jgi:hypothetical protein
VRLRTEAAGRQPSRTTTVGYTNRRGGSWDTKSGSGMFFLLPIFFLLTIYLNINYKQQLSRSGPDRNSAEHNKGLRRCQHKFFNCSLCLFVTNIVFRSMTMHTTVNTITTTPYGPLRHLSGEHRECWAQSQTLHVGRFFLIVHYI